MTAYLQLIVNPRDETAWKRVLKLIPKITMRPRPACGNGWPCAPEPLALVAPANSRGPAERAVAGWRERTDQQSDRARNDPQSRKQIEMVLERRLIEYLQANYENAEAREEDLRQLAKREQFKA